MKSFLPSCCLQILIFLSLILQGTIADLYQESLLVGDLIAQVNTNVKPLPLWNADIRKYSPAEQTFDPLKDVAGQLFEGCLTLDDKDMKMLTDQKVQKGDKQLEDYSKTKRWPSHTIPYEVVFLGLGDQVQGQLLAKIEALLQQIMESVCLNFRPKVEGDVNWILFYDGYGCHSDFGKKETSNLPTLISIGKGCQSDGIITHLLLHALGFLHEQNRLDRDNYIGVHLQNVKSDYAKMFEKHQFQNLDNQSDEYDYQSIMHFSKSAYGKGDDNPTMTAKKDEAMKLGARKLSPLDIQKINRMFECPNGQWQEWQDWSACSRPCGFGFHRRKRICKSDANSCIGKPSEMRVCRNRKCYPGPSDAVFENDWGIWKPRSGNKCNWRRGRTRSKKQLTGPQQDHTTGQGRFAQVQYGGACEKGVKATMYTKSIRPIYHQTCLSFFFFMKGKGAGKLDVMMKDITTRLPSLIWTREGDQGQDWQQAAITLPSIPISCKLYMVATIDEPGVSDISVDDIYIDVGKCPEGLEGCQDYHLRCKNWSLEGECYKNAGWMLHSCCRSCLGLAECVDEDPNCEEQAESGKCLANAKDMWSNCCFSCEKCLDQDNRCRSWARLGECNANPDWMLKNCKSSCGVCITTLD